jgi:hypothetical protein
MERESTRLTTIGNPPLFVTTMEQSPFADLRLALATRTAGEGIKMVRGKHARTVRAWFAEIGAALQFPYYFGENWPAFSEMIGDLDWLPADVYVLMIDDAHLLLVDGTVEDFTVLIQVLSEATAEWLTPNAYIPRDRRPTPFHTLFRCNPEELETFRGRLDAAGGSHEVLTV